MIENLSENVMIPIAGMIISAILCYELITMVMDKNNMHEVKEASSFSVTLSKPVLLCCLSAIPLTSRWRFLMWETIS